MKLIAPLIMMGSVLAGCVSPQGQEERHQAGRLVVADLQSTLKQLFPLCIAAAEGRGFDNAALEAIGFKASKFSSPGTYSKAVGPSFSAGITGKGHQLVTVSMNPSLFTGKQQGCDITMMIGPMVVAGNAAAPIFMEFRSAGYTPEEISFDSFNMRKGDLSRFFKMDLNRGQATRSVTVIIR